MRHEQRCFIVALWLLWSQDCSTYKGTDRCIRTYISIFMCENLISITASFSSSLPPEKMDRFEPPPWAADPAQPFRLEVLKRGVIVGDVDVSQQQRYVFGRK